MQQYSSKLARLLADARGNNGAPGVNNGSAPHPNAPLTGIYGSGKVRLFAENATFTIPAGVQKIRVRLWGAGASVAGGNPKAGGGGGGFAIGEFDVTPGSNHAIVVGTGTSSFGSLISATAGSGRIGGNGTGGYFQAKGGDAPEVGASSGLFSGGGGAGSLFGPGGNGAADGVLTGGNGGSGGGGGLNGSTPKFGAGGRGVSGDAPVASLDFLGTGSGGNAADEIDGPNGHNGGGGAGEGRAGMGGFPGGGAGGGSNSPSGGRGLVIVEW